MSKVSLSDNPIHWAKYVSLKGQKLTQAVYLVTSLFADSEPLKWRLRDISLEVLSDIPMSQPFDASTQSFSDGRKMSPIFKATVLESVIIKVDQLIAWLEVAVVGLASVDGNFSSANLDFLRQEYLDFNELLREKVQNTGLTKLVDLSGLEAELLLASSSSAVSIPPSELKSKESKTLSLKTTNQPNNPSYQKLNQLPHKNRDQAKDSRRSLILAFLKGKDWTSIKDINEAIDGCSAKTIQRELADLVHIGVLKKKGERRWSRYLLA